MARTVPLSALLAGVVFVALAAGTVAVSADEHGAVPADGPLIETAGNTSNHLGLSGDTRQTYVRAERDVAGATAVSVERLRGTHLTRTFQRRYESVEGSDARLTVVRETVGDVERRFDRLTTRQERLFRGYTNGSIDTTTFVRRLVHVQAEAAQTRSVLETVGTTVDTDLGTSLPFALDRRISRLTSDPLLLSAPITADLSGAVTASSDPVLVYVKGSNAGLVLARITGSQYSRQATLRSAYMPDEPNQYDGAITEAYRRALDLYPWVAENAINGPNLREQGGNVYRVAATHPHGELTTYLHGGSTAVFHEIQRKQTDGVPVTATVSNETDALNVTVERTTPTGPMRVSVARPDAGPTQAAISVNNQPVGSTGGDGRLWLVEPSGPVSVNATTADGNVSVSWP